MGSPHRRARPIHVHDCRGCRFVGSFDGKDVYQCDHVDLCIRWGDSDQDNKSFPISIVRKYKFEEGDWMRAVEMYEQSLLG